MIHQVLPIVVGELNDFFQMRFDTAEDSIVLGNIVSQDGSVAIDGENKVVASLINIERDGSNQTTRHGTQPPVNINLYIMFAAYFNQNNYAEALKFISGVIGFFQGKNNFNQHNTPMLPPGIENVRMEIVNVDFRELSNLWASLGAKYIPSVIYRMRTLNMEEDRITDDIPPIAGLGIF